MKHDLPFAPAQPAMAGQSETALALQLHLIESVAEDGTARLTGQESMAVLCPMRFTGAAVGSFAVCLGIDGGTLVVLGHLPVAVMANALAQAKLPSSETRPDQPLTLRCGRSQLQLHPDGRIRISGDDVIVQSNGRMGLRGAIIDLN